jgi:hypothetical protein
MVAAVVARAVLAVTEAVLRAALVALRQRITTRVRLFLTLVAEVVAVQQLAALLERTLATAGLVAVVQMQPRTVAVVAVAVRQVRLAVQVGQDEL